MIDFDSKYDEYINGDVCIVDSNYRYEEEARNKLKIDVDEFSNKVGAFIGRDYIIFI